MRASLAGAIGVALALGPRAALAQHEHDAHVDSARTSLRLGAQAIPIVTRTIGGPENVSRAEGALTQLMAVASLDAFGNHVFARAALNGEGWTLRRGDLALGAYGEGYFDRRHPHTYVHEIVAGGRAAIGQLQTSIEGGKGFIPFGSDDPMSRPFAKYPINHHLSQVIERAFVGAGASLGPVLIEGAVFNGDEPTSPGVAPLARRFADSWSLRATVRPAAALELSMSRADVQSPEFRTGEGLDHVKWHTSARWAPSAERPLVRYAMAEWASTRELRRGHEAFRFSSTLVETTLDLRVIDLSVRAERTTRPEEERLLDLFRVPIVVSDFGIIGRTRWDALTLAFSRDARVASLALAPFIECEVLRPRAVLEPALLDPRVFYGRSTLGMVTAGVRMSLGHRHLRMGRYGVAEAR